MPRASTLPARPYSFRLDNIIIDQYAAEMGAMGLALYAALARYADRQTGECFPSILTLCAKLQLGRTTVKKGLRKLESLGLIAIAPRWTAAGDLSSNLYTLLDPAPTAVAARRDRLAASAPSSGGGSPDDLPQSLDTLPLGHPVPHPRSSGDPEQVPAEQAHGTSAAAPQSMASAGDPPAPSAQAPFTSASSVPTAERACDHPLHEHRSPVPGLRMCFDCFRCWPVPLAGLPPTDAPAGRAEPRLTTACSG